MKNWLEDLNKTLGLGLILTFIIFLIRGYYGILDEISFWAFLLRWIHVVYTVSGLPPGMVQFVERHLRRQVRYRVAAHLV